MRKEVIQFDFRTSLFDIVVSTGVTFFEISVSLI